MGRRHLSGDLLVAAHQRVEVLPGVRGNDRLAHPASGRTVNIKTTRRPVADGIFNADVSAVTARTPAAR